MSRKDTENLKSFLGARSEFQGELRVIGTVRMEGMVTGKVQADQVILSETAVVKGDIMARRIVVGGIVEGNIRAPDLVEIQSKGKVRGEIITNKFLVMEGGEFNGQIEMRADESRVLDFEPKIQEVSLRRQ